MEVVFKNSIHGKIYNQVLRKVLMYVLAVTIYKNIEYKGIV